MKGKLIHTAPSTTFNLTTLSVVFLTCVSIGREAMSNKTFLITMDDTCFVETMGWCCGSKCDGELNNRPEWCPLKEVKWFQIYQGNDAYHEVKKNEPIRCSEFQNNDTR